MQCFDCASEGVAVRAQLLLAHGAGAGSQSDFMQQIGKALCGAGITTWLFDFPYMRTVYASGQKRPPDRAPLLIEAFHEAIRAVTTSDNYHAELGLWVGGKSMGGRMATHVVSDVAHPDCATIPLHGAVVLGYPFHPPGKPDTLRIDHFSESGLPVFIVQGARDTFGSFDEVEALSLPSTVEIVWLKEGDHSFKPRKRSGISVEQNRLAAAEHVRARLCI
ncbi:alpha/beta family hydrolase [Alteromonas oceanisediminis]|uniref:alpha/beta family hydrolase n=1 Tax=Alteromonas oceanisediminis TaxID=2836180 RepID=UPI001BD99280|nr:alpha/beta family hydrolase [Alteromonas oceanisediminis]MBT0587316.1 alpha/beta fold hydrolase [Alteromonas oceanisediminis]